MATNGTGIAKKFMHRSKIFSLAWKLIDVFYCQFVWNTEKKWRANIENIYKISDCNCIEFKSLLKSKGNKVANVFMNIIVCNGFRTNDSVCDCGFEFLICLRRCPSLMSTYLKYNYPPTTHSIYTLYWKMSFSNQFNKLYIDFCCNNLLNWYYLNEKKRMREIEWEKSNERWGRSVGNRLYSTPSNWLCR